MTVAAQQSYIDSNWWPAAVPVIQAEENTYLTEQNRYLQGLISHTVIPQHSGTGRGADATPDNLIAVISDQPHTLDNRLPPGIKGQKWPCAVVLDVYQGPQGWGWVATLMFRHTATPGQVHERAINFGPETYRNFGWKVQA